MNSNINSIGYYTIKLMMIMMTINDAHDDDITIDEDGDDDDL